MMDIFNMLGGMGNAQQQLSQQTGATPQQTESALEAAVPLLLGAMTRNAATPQGAAALDSALDQHSGDALGLFQQGQMPDQNEGQKILGHVFGGQQSAAVNAVSQRAGISSQTAMQILMTLAPLVLNYLAQQRGGQSGGMSGGAGGGIGGVLGSILGGGGLGSVLGQVLGGGQGQTQSQSGGLGGGMGGGLGDVLGQVLGGGQSQQPQSFPTQTQSTGTQGGQMFPGYTGDDQSDQTQPTQPQNTQQGQGGLFGTLENVLGGGGNGNALNDLIGMFGGRKS